MLNCSVGEDSVIKRSAAEDRRASRDVRQSVRPALARWVGAATLWCIARLRREAGLLINGVRSGIEDSLPTSSGRWWRRSPGQSRPDLTVLAIVQAVFRSDFDATTVLQGAYAKKFATNSNCRNSLAALEIPRFACHSALFCGPSPSQVEAATMIRESQGSTCCFGDSTATNNSRPGDAIS